MKPFEKLVLELVLGLTEDILPDIKSCSVILDRNVLDLEDSDLELVILLPNPCVGKANVPKP